MNHSVSGCSILRLALSLTLYYNIPAYTFALMDTSSEAAPGLCLFALRGSVNLPLVDANLSGVMGKECFHASAGLDLPVL